MEDNYNYPNVNKDGYRQTSPEDYGPNGEWRPEPGEFSGRGEASQGDLYNDRRQPGGGGHRDEDPRARGKVNDLPPNSRGEPTYPWWDDYGSNT